ncbi:MAG: hypothetical protein J5I98_30320 [Phaeodactylibacter sp.]|nr:hypothetical protein [Phaeodactylibacter sp.]
MPQGKLLLLLFAFAFAGPSYAVQPPAPHRAALIVAVGNYPAASGWPALSSANDARPLAEWRKHLIPSRRKMPGRLPRKRRLNFGVSRKKSLNEEC